MKRLILLSSLCLLTLGSFAQKGEADKAAIREVLRIQQDAWNSFDIPKFMDGYWHSDKMTFVNSKGVTYGWDNMKKRYEKNYPSQDAMGTLTFEIKELNLTGKKSAMLIGSWFLKRPVDGDVGGFFTLVFQKINGEWKIINDHTS